MHTDTAADFVKALRQKVHVKEFVALIGIFLIATAVCAYMLMNRISPFGLEPKLEMQAYFDRAWKIVLATFIVAIILRIIRKNSIVTLTIFSTCATIALTPVPYAGWFGTMPNGIIAYYSTPFNAFHFIYLYNTIIISLAAFSLIFVLSRFIIGLDLSPKDSKKKIFLWLLLVSIYGAWSAFAPRPKGETDALINDSIAYIQQRLNEHSDFLPCGAVVDSKNQISYISVMDSDLRTSDELIDVIRRDFEGNIKNGRYKMTSLIYDATIELPSSGTKTDAIIVSAKYKDDYAIVKAFPYSFYDGQVVFQEGFTIDDESSASHKARRITTQSRGPP